MCDGLNQMQRVPAPDNERRLYTASQLRRDVDALHAALREACEGRDYNADALRSAVAQLATTARASGLTPERMLKIIKAATAHNSLDHLSRWWRNVLMDRAVRWGIEAYYGQQPGSS